MDIVEISEKRYTAKRYDKNKSVSREDLEKLLTVLRNSPSSVNSQPWHFVVVNNATSQNKILPAILDFNHARITDSTYTIIFCIKTSLDNDYLTHILDTEIQDGRFTKPEIIQSMDKDRRYFIGLNSITDEKLHSWESCQLYLALGQFMFAAASIGIDSTPIEGFDAQKMDELLGLKEKGLKSIVVASIGYHADNDSNAKRPKSRLPKEEIFTFV
ncbi:Nitroreductase (NfnB) (PDB:1F5V) [Commensalibacter communis]|uniref:oxygen-insensitive NAD(P)H nitroreductase n=1 Tax=Commensalibacter communis TaxID=2972786 RepID=UPI0022FFA840|nr:oxygen-insensitive NAD(P)H nitroreductase [Commensalibacter communis]CAI3950797.1 Nitroreductase (NfnB) (PDB:1F5V) [Commensalibacter communis]CAI3953593.1 Nitroreductase (NfnB) (PDB:1F5V) [Commensalibacter communis]